MKRHNMLSFLLCVLLIAGLLTGCGTAFAGGGDPVSSPAGSSAGTSSPVPADTGSRSPKKAASYDEVLKAINAAASRNTYWGSAYDVREESAGKPDSATAASSVPAPAGDGLDAGSADYSQTNVQVSGVDEGDIVKTDGSYIYVLRNNELIIFKADGASTEKISSVLIAGSESSMPMPGYDGRTPEESIYTSEYASDIYVTGDTAMIVSSCYSYGPYMTDSAVKAAGAESDISASVAAQPDIAPMRDQQISKLYIYDITDRANPVKKAELGQDGYILSTRLIGTTLYMLSTYYVYSADEKIDDTYIPRLYDGGTSKLVSPDCIAIMPYFSSTAYTVICAYDVAGASLSANQSILGGGSTVYMNKDTLFVASSTNDQTESAPYADSVYTVIDYTMTSVTDIAGFDISGGGLILKASGSVPGSLDNQFALDEYSGNLRVVTTTYSQSWSEYTDKDKGFVNYVYKDPYTANALYVLDGGLKVIGSVGDLAPGERVYSVRFDGQIGYFVTFRQVDPLFAVDLSEPANPQVLSALKIPGFSEYLHLWGDGRLFGLGMDADAETGRTDGMKLTMFDTTDPADVTVKQTLKLDTSYSNALYNHKAILISPDKSLIAFPADSGYDIYGYSDEQGFYKRASVSSVEWSGDSRGLYIGDFAYIVDYSSVSILDMNSYKLVDRISY
jgi:uncharacterized secreted protein with C-terminal beta-propeller domain